MSYLLDTNVVSELRKGQRADSPYVRDLTLVTRNGRDVARTGVRSLNPFEKKRR